VDARGDSMHDARMSETTMEVRPGPRERTVRAADGAVLAVPDGWELLAPGDALVTRKVKAGGPYWAVSERVRNKDMSRGVWAPATRIANARAASELQRGSPEHARQLAAGRARREREQGRRRHSPKGHRVPARSSCRGGRRPCRPPARRRRRRTRRARRRPARDRQSWPTAF